MKVLFTLRAITTDPYGEAYYKGRPVINIRKIFDNWETPTSDVVIHTGQKKMYATVETVEQHLCADSHTWVELAPVEQDIRVLEAQVAFLIEKGGWTLYWDQNPYANTY